MMAICYQIRTHTDNTFVAQPQATRVEETHWLFPNKYYLSVLRRYSQKFVLQFIQHCSAGILRCLHNILSSTVIYHCSKQCDFDRSHPALRDGVRWEWEDLDGIRQRETRGRPMRPQKEPCTPRSRQDAAQRSVQGQPYPRAVPGGGE